MTSGRRGRRFKSCQPDQKVKRSPSRGSWRDLSCRLQSEVQQWPSSARLRESVSEPLQSVPCLRRDLRFRRAATSANCSAVVAPDDRRVRNRLPPWLRGRTWSGGTGVEVRGLFDTPAPPDWGSRLAPQRRGDIGLGSATRTGTPVTDWTYARSAGGVPRTARCCRLGTTTARAS